MTELRFIYGAGFVQVDVSKQATEAFVRENRLSIAKDASFNEIFGDVMPNEAKTLLVTFEDKTFISLPENRSRDFKLDFS